MTFLPIGKLPAALLQKLLERYTNPDSSVILGPRVGEDATVISLGDQCLVAKTDPVTLAMDEIGWYSVHVNANDIACCGATPRWYLAAILLPESKSTVELVERIFQQIHEACGQLGVSFCGGHTEITHGLQSPIVVGQMLGIVAPDKYVTSNGARVGDKLILTKGIALEGTAILAREQQDILQGVLSATKLERCTQFLYNPGISVVKDAQLALETGGVHALHDPTEGGIATGLWELAQASNVGLIIEESHLPIFAECQVLCQYLGLNPLGLIASGSLLIVAAEDSTTAIIQRLQSEGIMATEIGKIVPPEQGCCILGKDQKLRPLPVFTRDEFTRIFDMRTCT